MLDHTVTIGNLITIVTIVGGFVWAASRQSSLISDLKDDVKMLAAFMAESREDRQALRERIIRLEAALQCPILAIPPKDKHNG